MRDIKRSWDLLDYLLDLCIVLCKAWLFSLQTNKSWSYCFSIDVG